MADSLYVTIWEDMVSRLENMRVAEGYKLDYGKVLEGAQSRGLQESDFPKPKIGLRWIGESPVGDPISSGELAGGHTQRVSLFEVTVPVRDNIRGRHTQRAFNVQCDVDKAFLETPTVRSRGISHSCSTWASDVRWLDDEEGGTGQGGTLMLLYTVRWRHTTGDLTSQ